MNRPYKDYFNINPKYYAAVTAELIDKGDVKWDEFYPHETFVKLLEKTHIMLSGKDNRSLWVEGAYGTGKSHAALTIKSLLEASDNDIRRYFKEYGLDDDLCQKLITDKSNGKLITIHRIGSSSIYSDQDLIIALQTSITTALQKHGIVNRGEASLREAALRWLEAKEANREYFDKLIQEEQYMWDFGGNHVDEVISALKSKDEKMVSDMMRKVLKVAEDNWITGLRLDIPGMCDWIKSIIDENDDISAILFVWDEFTEYFNNTNSLTGFQTLVEISASHPFYFLIVTHESSSLIKDKDMRKKILNRFVGDVTVRIEMPENMAFRLMAQAMKTTEDPVLLKKWQEYKGDLNKELSAVRNTIITNAKQHSTMGQKTIISDSELQGIVPIHPYAALLLKHMSVAFNSNARSMFDFIISTDTTDARGFRWFIEQYGPLDSKNLLTIDMLWEFFTEKDQNNLDSEVRSILDSYRFLKKNSLSPDEERVFKTILLLEAISQRVGGVELLLPNEQNIDLAFSGTDWAKGKARSLAAGLHKKELLFEKAVNNGVKEYTVATKGGNVGQIKLLEEDIRGQLKTQELISDAELMDVIKLRAGISHRYLMEGAALSNISQVVARMKGDDQQNRFKTIVVFALDDSEITTVKMTIKKIVEQESNNLIFIESLSPMGNELLDAYIKNMALSKNYLHSDFQRSKGFEQQAANVLQEWKTNIAKGAFVVYTSGTKNGFRVANLDALNEELQRNNRSKYPYSLEQYNLTDNMFTKGPLALGAECGITEELKLAFNIPNVKTSIPTALAGAWKVKDYWKDPSKQSLSIVRIKIAVEKLITEELNKDAGRIGILSIYEMLENAPFGFMPNNITAFVMGFVLKEYANKNYFWSMGSAGEPMTTGRMKQMIAEAINYKFSPNAKKYSEEYIVAMSDNKRCFLQFTAKAFNIPEAQCSTIETARDQIRIKMKEMIFPIWCLKSILNKEPIKSSESVISTIIDDYCGIANTANSKNVNEGELAEEIGQLVAKEPTVATDIEQLLTDDMCQKGMREYIAQYRGGLLKKLAAEIGDGGAYLEQVREKFSADAANWVWNSVTADERISDVILEYHIIAESNKSLPKSTNLQGALNNWNKRSDNIRIPYEELRKYTGSLSGLLEQLYYLKETGQLQEQYKYKFYDELLKQRENFDQFYKEQLPYFKQAAKVFIGDLDEQAIAEFFDTIPSGQFIKSSSMYYQYLEKAVKDYQDSLKKNRLKKIWVTKTKTKNPEDWSEKYKTPILCMFDDADRGEAAEIFDVILAYSSSDAEITRAITYLENASFYEKLNNKKERDYCFMKRVVGKYCVMLQDVEAIREELYNSGIIKPYKWMDNAAIQNILENLAEKQYKLTGCDEAKAVIAGMDANELRKYLNKLIADNLTIGMEILKNK